LNTQHANEGSVIEYSELGRVEGRLYDFGVDSATVLLMHSLWLNDHVVPVLKAGGSVAITGLTSRSGSTAHNLKLSERRAKAVLDLLRFKVRRPVSYRMDPGYREVHAIGVGEAHARRDGQDDRTEDGFYRAVLVTVWHNPNPPPPPEPKAMPAASPLVKRVTSRMWSKFNTRSQIESGETGAELGELVNDVISGVKDGGSDTRTYAMIPSDYVVGQVQEDFVLNDHISAINSSTLNNTIKYTWVPPYKGLVLLVKRTRLIRNGRDFGWKEERRSYFRDDIWKHTKSPDARVYW
jgi:hypothetical protein